MSHPHRFFAPYDEITVARVPLPPEEAHHALRVARLKQGDRVSVINGRGGEISGTLMASGRRDAFVEVMERRHCPPPRVAVTLAPGGLHQDKLQQEIIRRAVETGVSRVCFWQADHSQKSIVFQERWLRTAVESCKQCGRFYLPAIDTAPSLEAFLEQYSGPGIIGLPEADPTAPVTVELTDRLAVLVGPEGDFSTREKAIAADFGMAPVSLGGYVYRSETAAAFLMTLVADRLGELGPALTVTSKMCSGKGME